MGSEAKEMVRRAGPWLVSDSKSGFCAMSLRCIRGLLFVLFSNAGVLLQRYGLLKQLVWRCTAALNSSC